MQSNSAYCFWIYLRLFTREKNTEHCKTFTRCSISIIFDRFCCVESLVWLIQLCCIFLLICYTCVFAFAFFIFFMFLLIFRYPLPTPWIRLVSFGIDFGGIHDLSFKAHTIPKPFQQECQSLVVTRPRRAPSLVLCSYGPVYKIAPWAKILAYRLQRKRTNIYWFSSISQTKQPPPQLRPVIAN